MKVTSKGQVTIPQRIREKLGIGPESEVEFLEQGGKVVLRKAKGSAAAPSTVRALRGSATIRLSTDEILSLTRD